MYTAHECLYSLFSFRPVCSLVCGQKKYRKLMVVSYFSAKTVYLVFTMQNICIVKEMIEKSYHMKAQQRLRKLCVYMCVCVVITQKKIASVYDDRMLTSNEVVLSV